MPAYTHYIEPKQANYSCRISWSDQEMMAANPGTYEGTYTVSAVGYHRSLETVVIRVQTPRLSIIGGQVTTDEGRRFDISPHQFDVLLCYEQDAQVLPYDITWRKV